MVACLAGGAKDTHALGVFPRQDIRAHRARRRGAQPCDRDVVRQLARSNLADDDRFKFPLRAIVKHGHGIVQSRIFLMVGHRLYPLAVCHQAGGPHPGYASLMDADAHSRGDVNAPSWSVDLRVLSPLAKSCSDSVDRLGHTDDAPYLTRPNQPGLNHLASLLTYSLLTASP